MAHPLIIRGTGHAGPKGKINVEVTVEPWHSLSDEEMAKEIIRIRKLAEQMYEGYDYEGSYGHGHD